LLKEMTLDEKVTIVHGGGRGFDERRRRSGPRFPTKGQGSCNLPRRKRIEYQVFTRRPELIPGSFGVSFLASSDRTL
jgi:hypothetical protein